MPKKSERGAEATPHVHNIKRKEPTQEEIALTHLKRNGSLTTLEAVRELFIMNPQDAIMRLRKKGYEIDTVFETTPKGKRYGRYVLREEK